VAGFLQQFCWSYTSVRQTNRLRRRYLTAVLRQDVAFFDTQVCTHGVALAVCWAVCCVLLPCSVAMLWWLHAAYQLC
jgi:hypothetical protein